MLKMQNQENFRKKNERKKAGAALCSIICNIIAFLISYFISPWFDSHIRGDGA